MLSDDPTVREFGGKYAENIVLALQHLFAADKIHLVQDVILKTVGNGLRQFEERLQRTLTALNFDSLKQEQLSNLGQLLLYVENYVMQMFRDLLTKDPPILSPQTLMRCDTTVLPTKPTKSKRDILRETFQTTHNELMEHIEPDGLLRDHLAQKKIITSSDEESIASSVGRRGRTRKLLSIVASTSTEQIEEGFLPALKATHPNLAENFVKTYKALEERPNTPSASETCLSCRIKSEVDPSRIAHVLYTRKSINTTVYEDLCNTSVSNQKKWKIISDKEETHIAVIEALKTKYKGLYQQCQYLHTRDLNCNCPTLNLNRPTQLTADIWKGDELHDPEDTQLFKTISAAYQNPSNSSLAGLSSISSIYPDRQTMQPRRGARLTVSSAASATALSDFYECDTRRGVKRTMSPAFSIAALSDFSEFEQGVSVCSDDHELIGTKRFRSFEEESEIGFVQDRTDLKQKDRNTYI